MKELTFADLEDDFNAPPAQKVVTVGAKPADMMQMSVSRAQAQKEMHRDKCNGSNCMNGFWYGNPSKPCFKCKGKGFLDYKTSPEERKKSREAAAKKRDRNIENFSSKHPDVWQWLEIAAENEYTLAVMYRALVRKKGTLTEGQLAAAVRNMNRRSGLQKKTN